MEIIEKRRNQREKIIKDAKDYVNNYDFKCSSLLIGSYARGDFNLWSDVDILIIAKFEGNPLERLKTLTFPPGYEIISLTPDEVNSKILKKDKFILDALKDGIMLRDDYSIKKQ